MVIAFKTSYRIIDKLKNTKLIKDPLSKSGIYSLRCDDCNTINIGETDRNLETRYKEHLINQTSKVFRQ